MKDSSTIIANNSVLVKLVKAVALLAFLSSTVACSNYTIAPVCNLDNAVSPPGLTGTYTLSLQNEDFSTRIKNSIFVIAMLKDSCWLKKKGSQSLPQAFALSTVTSYKKVLMMKSATIVKKG